MRLRNGFLVGVLGCMLALGGCDDESDPDGGTGHDAGTQTDAGPGPVDSGPTDAGPTDSGPADGGPADGGPVDGGPTDAGPIDGGPTEGHCDAGHLIIAEIDPGTSITVYNPTSAPVDTSTGYLFCSRPSYPTLNSIEAGVTIAAGASHTFAWPSSISDTDAGGEIALYRDSSYGSAESLLDFVCWGTGHSGLTRRSIAEMDGDWSGACAGAITGDSLTRIPETDGSSAASYDPTGASAALSCE